MQHLPVFADLRDRDCLVVGGGSVAERRTLLLIDAGAKVHLVAPELSETLAELAADGKITHHARVYDDERLEDYWLVIAATDDRAQNARIAADANAARRLCNAVDDPALC